MLCSSSLSENNKYLQNVSFDYGDVHFIGADFVSRDPERSEAGSLNNESDGTKVGTWQWVLDDVNAYVAGGKRKKRSINIFSHIPMASRVPVHFIITINFELGAGFDFPGVVTLPPIGFTDAQRDGMADDLIDAHVVEYLGDNYCGHLHFNANNRVWLDGMRASFVTHPTWSPTQCDKATAAADNWTVRYVKVITSGDSVEYKQELIERVPNSNALDTCYYN